MLHQGKAPSLCPSRCLSVPCQRGTRPPVPFGRCVLLRVIWVKITISSSSLFPRVKGGRGGGVGSGGRVGGRGSPRVCGARSPRPWRSGARSSPRRPRAGVGGGGGRRGRRATGTRLPPVVSAVRPPRGGGHTHTRTAKPLRPGFRGVPLHGRSRRRAGSLKGSPGARPGPASRGAGCPPSPASNFAESFLPSGRCSRCCFHQQWAVRLAFSYFAFFFFSL